jgi:hypothetical protein
MTGEGGKQLDLGPHAYAFVTLWPPHWAHRTSGSEQVERQSDSRTVSGAPQYPMSDRSGEIAAWTGCNGVIP